MSTQLVPAKHFSYKPVKCLQTHIKTSGFENEPGFHGCCFGFQINQHIIFVCKMLESKTLQLLFQLTSTLHGHVKYNKATLSIEKGIS